MSEKQAEFWTTGYLPNGCRVSFTIPVTMLDAYETALAFTDALLKKGFRQTEDGVEAGEEKISVGWICRTSKVNDDGSETPVVNLYKDLDALKFATIKVYLNTDDEQAAFEAASGVKVASLPLYDGDRAPERGKGKDKYIHRMNVPFDTIIKKNPRYNPDEEDIKKRKPQYLFVRWDGAAGQQQTEDSKPEPELQAATFTVLVVQTLAKKSDGKPYYQMATGKEYVYAFSRDVFREAGYSDKLTDSWKEIGHSITLKEPFQLKAVRTKGDNGKEYWRAVPTGNQQALPPTGTDGAGGADDIPW